MTTASTTVIPASVRATTGRPPRWTVLASGAGQLMMTLGLVVLLFAGWLLHGGDTLATDHAQHRLLSQLQNTWQHGGAGAGAGAGAGPGAGTGAGAGAGASTNGSASSGLGSSGSASSGSTSSSTAHFTEGSPVAVIHIPKFGSGWTPRIIVQGTSLADLHLGPGHYTHSQLPGQVGNFAVAGHRAFGGDGFYRLNELTPGDPIFIDYGSKTYTYAVVKVHDVLPTDVDVVDPVPNHPESTPTQRLITLTTCDPWYSATHRLVVLGHLVKVGPRISSNTN